MPLLAYPRLIHRGHFPLRRITTEDYLIGTEYPGGYREDAIVGAPIELHAWELSFPYVSHHKYVELPTGERKTRFEYLRDFRRASKANGNWPFVIQDPVDGLDYLAIFADDSVSMTVTKTPEQPMQMETTMLIKQVFVRGVNFLDDGSLGDYTGNAEI